MAIVYNREKGVYEDDGSGQNTPQNPNGEGAPPQRPSNREAIYGSIADVYKKELGRDIGDGEYKFNATEGPDGQYNYTSADWADKIKNSAEAQAYRAKQAPTTTNTTGAPPSQYAGIEGVDVGKLNDANWNSPKYKLARLISQGLTTQQIAAQLGGKAISEDVYEWPDGARVDITRDQEGAAQKQYLEIGYAPGSAGYSAQQVAGGGGGTGGAGATSGGGGGGGLHDKLLAELTRNIQNPISGDSPYIQNQVNSFRDEQSRGFDRSRDALTERAAYRGDTTGSVDSAIQSGMELGATNTARFQGDLIQTEHTRQRDELMNQLSMALNNERFYDEFAYNINNDQNSLDTMLWQYLYGG